MPDTPSRGSLKVRCVVKTGFLTNPEISCFSLIGQTSHHFMVSDGMTDDG